MTTIGSTQRCAPAMSTSVKPSIQEKQRFMVSNLQRVHSLDDFEDMARRYLPRPLFGYVAGAVEDSTSLNDNRAAFHEIGFIPRNVVDVSKRSTHTDLLGRRYAAPFGIAPMGISALTAYRGDLVQARAARARNIPMIMSGSSLIRLEDVAAECPDIWFQVYLPAESSKIDALIERVAGAGIGTLVLTVDSQILSNREHNLRAGFSTPLRPSLRLAWDGITHPGWLFGTALPTLMRHGMPHFENNYLERGAPILSRSVERDFGGRDHITWAHIKRVRRQWSGQLVVKGVMCAEDARFARECGADGVIVSNHGGRQLDSTISPMRVLASIVEQLDPVPVMIDSGFRRGSDVLKAIALGAKFVFVGRPFNYAAAVAGQAGVERAIDLLSSEVHRNMGMLGLNNLEEISAEKIVPMAGYWEGGLREKRPTPEMAVNSCDMGLE